MINSLSKDSHITRQSRAYSKYSVSGNQNQKQNQNKHIGCSVNSQYNVKNQLAQPSFTGFFSASSVKKFVCSRDIESLSGARQVFNEIAGNNVSVKEYFLKDLLTSAKEFVVGGKGINKEDKEAIKSIHKSTKDLIEKSIDSIQNPETAIADDSVKQFLSNETNSKTINELLEKIKNETKFKNKKDDEFEFDINTPDYKKFVKEKVNEAVDVLHSVENPGWFHKSEGVKNFLKSAEKSQAVFSASFAAVLACALRPATIVSLPGKKNKDDKRYASAHSIASGAIGYIFATIVSSPIAKGIEKITRDPKKYLEDKHINNYINEKDVKNNLEFAKTKRFSIARGYLNLIPELLTAPIKAMMTIALIPPILKYVFGLEKKSHKANSHNLGPQKSPPLAFKSASEPVRQVFQKFIGEAK